MTSTPPAPDLFPAAVPAVSLDRQITCVERELRKRASVYPRLVQARKMSQSVADQETAVMRAVLLTLEELRAGQRGSDAP